MTFSYCAGCEDKVPFVAADPVCQICGTLLNEPDLPSSLSTPPTATTNPLQAQSADAAQTTSSFPAISGLHALLGGQLGGSANNGLPLAISDFDLIDLFSGHALGQLVEQASTISTNHRHTEEDTSGGGGNGASEAGTEGSAGVNGAPLLRQNLTELFRQLMSQPEIMSQLQQQSSPAASSAIERLPTRTISAGDRWLQQVCLSLSGMPGNIICEPAAFGGASKLQDGNSMKAPLIAVEPIKAASQLRNAANLKDCIAICQRGGSTFAEKALRCQEAGAAAVVIIQSVDVWPYIMTDSTGRGKSIEIPVIMMKREHGLHILEMLTEEEQQGSKNEDCANMSMPTRATLANISAGMKNGTCPICFEDVVGTMCTQLPCMHVYHKDCIERWLKIRNACPTCRSTLPRE